MAKPATVESTNAVVATGAGSLPTFLAERAAEDAGKGVSNLQDDNIIPLVYVLQAQSPQCNKRSPDYVEGAEAGSLWLRNSGRPAISSETGVLFQPCYFSKDWIEWVLRDNGGGYAGRHDERPADAVETPDAKDPSRTRWMRPNGNEVIETRYHIGYVIFEDNSSMPYVIPFSGSGHTVSRGWMTMMNSKQIGENVAPSWAALYRLKTKERTNKKGTWMTFDVTDAGWITTQAEYERGAKLNTSFAAGEKSVEAPASQDNETHADAAM